MRDEDWTRRLLDLLAIGHAHFAFQDLVIDRGGATPELCLISDVCLLRYLDGLPLLGRDGDDPDRYRALHDQYYRWYVASLSIELDHRRRLRHFTPAEIVAMGCKAAPGNTTLHVVAARSGHGGAEAAVRAVMQLCAGLQVLDDLNDLAEDHQRGNLTMPLTETLLCLPPERRDELDSEDLIAVAAHHGVTSSCLDIADQLFGQAAGTASAGDAQVLAALAEMWIRRVDTRRRQLDAAMAHDGPSD